jgi:hypothetical protein
MATVEMLMDNLIAAMQDATTGLSPNIVYFKDLPSAQQLSNLSRPGGNDGQAVCYIFDLDMSRDTTRWASFNIAQTINPVGTNSVLSSNALGGDDSITLTLYPTLNLTVGGTITAGDVLTLNVINSSLGGSELALPYTVLSSDTTTTIAAYFAGTINNNTTLKNLGLNANSNENLLNVLAKTTNLTTFSTETSENATETLTMGSSPEVNDGVSFVAQLGTITYFNTYIATSSDTLATMATKLAANINADPNTSQWVSAAASGRAIAITSIIPEGLSCYTQTGNQGTTTTVVGNECRSMLITLQTRLYQDRDTLGEPIKTVLFQLQNQANSIGQQFLQLTDTTWMRVRINHNRMGRTDHLTNTYRWDYVLDIEYSVTAIDKLYSILAVVPIKTVN